MFKEISMPEEKFYTGKKVKPSLMKLTFGDIEKVVYKVDVVGDEYEMCNDFSSNMWANKKTGFYGRGMINSKDDPHKAERIGKLGEMAFSKVFGFPVDFTYREGGDKYDFVCNKFKVDVKTSSKRPWYEAGLITATNKNGNPMELKSDIYIFGYVMLEDREKKISSIILVGGCDKETVINRPMSKAKVGNHLNYEILYKESTSIKDIKFDH